MEAEIADALNARTARMITARLDWADTNVLPGVLPYLEPWYCAPMGETLMNFQSPDWAWMVGMLAQRVPGLDFTGPADEDWENLFSHFEAQILARRDPQTPPARTAENQPAEVV